MSPTTLRHVKQTQLEIELKKLPGAIKRKIAGLEFFVTRTKGSGRIAFSRDSPGQCIPLHLHLRQGEGLDVRAAIPARTTAADPGVATRRG